MVELTKENVILLAAVCTAAGTVFGALSGALSALVSAWLNRKFDERKHYRELVFRAAIETWKDEYPNPATRRSLESYIARMDMFYEVFIEENPNPSRSAKKNQAYQAFVDAWHEANPKTDIDAT